MHAFKNLLSLWLWSKPSADLACVTTAGNLSFFPQLLHQG
jgi:hypothetical protein